MQFWIITINQLPTETISHWYRDALMAGPNTLSQVLTKLWKHRFIVREYTANMVINIGNFHKYSAK